MKSARLLAVVLVLAALPDRAAAAPPAKAPPAPPLTPLAMLPSIPRVRVDVLEKKVVVVEEVNLPRGEWSAQALDFYVAFGAPGAPRAIDAQLMTVGDGALEPDDADAGEALVIERAPRRPPSAYPLLGRESMAGVVVHVKAESFGRALKPGNMAALRIRTALDLPDEDPEGARGVVVRLGSSRGTPLTLGRLVLAGKSGGPAPTRAEARLCGAEADPTPLAIALVPKSSAVPASPPIAPVLAVRHTTDDLCVRFWTP